MQSSLTSVKREMGFSIFEWRRGLDSIIESRRLDSGGKDTTDTPIGPKSTNEMFHLNKCNVTKEGLRRMSTNAGKEKVVILGIGWGGYRLARDLNKVSWFQS